MNSLMTLAEAAASLHANLTARSLRTEIDKGRLSAVLIAGKQFVTKEALQDFLRLAQIPALPPAPPRASDMPSRATSPFSSADANASVQRALQISQMLKKPSKRISRPIDQT